MDALQNHFWGGGLVLLGAWELLALASKGKIPTITRLCVCPSRKALVLAWMFGAAVHVSRSR